MEPVANDFAAIAAKLREIKGEPAAPPAAPQVDSYGTVPQPNGPAHWVYGTEGG